MSGRGIEEGKSYQASDYPPSTGVHTKPVALVVRDTGIEHKARQEELAR